MNKTEHCARTNGLNLTVSGVNAGLQDAWQELQTAAADFWCWHVAHARQQLHVSWQHWQQSAPHVGEHIHQHALSTWQQLQAISPSTAVPVAVLVLAMLAAVRAVIKERQVTAWTTSFERRPTSEASAKRLRRMHFWA